MGGHPGRGLLLPTHVCPHTSEPPGAMRAGVWHSPRGYMKAAPCRLLPVLHGAAHPLPAMPAGSGAEMGLECQGGFFRKTRDSRLLPPPKAANQIPAAHSEEQALILNSESTSSHCTLHPAVPGRAPDLSVAVWREGLCLRKEPLIYLQEREPGCPKHSGHQPSSGAVNSRQAWPACWLLKESCHLPSSLCPWSHWLTRSPGPSL